MSLEDLFKDESIVPILLVVFVLFAVIVLIFNWSLHCKEEEKRQDDLNKPTEMQEAKIIAKEISNSNVYCYITFELRNGERKRFTLQKNQASLFFENDKGVLKYKGNTFVEFRRTPNNEEY